LRIGRQGFSFAAQSRTCVKNGPLFVASSASVRLFAANSEREGKPES
jgi:hypothetical protein